MKILWLCNMMLPVIAKELGLPFSSREGWLTGTYEQFVREENRQWELGICFPISKNDREFSFSIGAVKCYGFRENLNMPQCYHKEVEISLKKILEDFQPDVVHIFGTEFPHTLAMIRAWERPSQILLGIQGLCYKIAEVYTQGIPPQVIQHATFRDLVKRDSLRDQQRKFRLRGENEKEAIRQVTHIAGRTRFDREEVLGIHPEAVYHSLNETMRGSFYTGRWERKTAEPYSIFLSQGDYPIKGFHYMLQAMPKILEKHPKAHLYVAGNPIFGGKITETIKLSSYGKYLKSLIRQHHLEHQVTLLGKLEEAAMKAQFLKSSVFVCPSVLENSPNALGEAMLLGVPVVAAATGGIPDLVTDGKEGLLYPAGNIAALADAIEKAWNPEGSLSLSGAAALRAAGTHNRHTNYERLMEVYHEINLCL